MDLKRMPKWQQALIGTALGAIGIFILSRFEGPTAPEGYTLVRGDAPRSGRLFGERPAASASEVLALAIRELAPFFDQSLEVVAAARDQRDGIAEALFRARLDGDVVAGAVLATADHGRGLVNLAYGEPQQLQRTLSSLLASPMAKDAASAPAPAAIDTSRWQVHRYPDGSGRLSLPDGWQITVAQRGLVGAVGPQGRLHKGLEVEVVSTAHARMLMNMGSSPNGIGIVADSDNPVNAMISVLPQIGRLNNKLWQVTNVRSVAPYPVQYPLTAAAFVDVEEIEGTEPLRCLASVILSNPQSSGIWLYAQSQVCDRPQTFAANLPVLLAIWGSAETSPAEFQRRYGSILIAIPQIGEIVAGGQTSAAANLERGGAASVEALRGTRILQELGTGQQFDVNLADAGELARALNAMPGSPGYVEIPRAQLVR